MDNRPTAVAIRSPLADRQFGSADEANTAYAVHLKEVTEMVPQKVKQAYGQIAESENSKFLLKAALAVGAAVGIGYIVLQILGMLIAAAAAFGIVGGTAWWWKFKLPGKIARAQHARMLEIQRAYNQYVEAAQIEKNRHLAALKAEARKNPIEQLQIYLQSKEQQLKAYQGFVTQVGGQVKSAGDMLAERKLAKPGRDYTKKDEALKAMVSAYQFHLDKSEQGRKALEALKEAVDDAKFDYQFGQVGQAAMQQMQALEGQDLLNEMLAAESFASVRDNFNLVFSEIEVQVGTINSAKQIDFGEGITLDVSNIHIPTTTKVNGTMSNQKDPFANLAPPPVEQSGGKSSLILGIIAVVVVIIGYIGWQQLKKPNPTPAPAVVQAPAPAPAPTPTQAVQQPQGVPASVANNQPNAGMVANQEQPKTGITICSGPANGAFEKVVADINRLGLGLAVKPSTGAGDNLTFMHDGLCEYGLINSDDYWGRVNAGNDPRIKNTRVVMGLFEGVVHMVAKSKEKKFSEFDGKRVGVTGGAVATFNTLIVPKTKMTFDVVAYKTTTELVAALADGSVDLIVMVGAKPQPWLKSVNIPGAHLVEFDRFDAVDDIMTGKKDGFLGKRPVGSNDYPNLTYEMKVTADGKSEAKPVIQLTTRTVLATTKDANVDPAVAAKTKQIFSVLSQNIANLRKDGHDSWKTVTTMNDPGGLPWATIRGPDPARVSSKNNSFSPKVRLNSPCAPRAACVAMSAHTTPPAPAGGSLFL